MEQHPLIPNAPINILDSECTLLLELGHRALLELRRRKHRGSRLRPPYIHEVALAGTGRAANDGRRVRPIRPAVDHRHGRRVAGADEEIFRAEGRAQRQVESELLREAAHTRSRSRRLAARGASWPW